MEKAEFIDYLSDILKKVPSSSFKHAYKSLRTIADDIKQVLSEGKEGDLFVDFLPGEMHGTTQQFNLRVAIPNRKWEQDIFRVYVPIEGFPIKVGDERLECTNNEELEAAILFFMSKPGIAHRVPAIRDML